MRDLMLGLQVLTGASVTTSLQLLHLGFKTTQGSAPLIPVVAFYNSKDGVLLFFFFLLYRIRPAVQHLSPVSNMAAAALAFSSHCFHVF